MIDKPEFHKIRGNGKLYDESRSYTVDFDVFHINGNSVIYCYTDEQMSSANTSHIEHLSPVIDEQCIPD